MKTLVLLLAPVAACLGAINVSVQGTTATQALIEYTAPDTNSCTIAVSQSPSLTPLIPDVDPTIFANANIDIERTSTMLNGLTRLVVIGHRSAQLATIGPYLGLRHFSRAAQAATTHYGLITCPSTGDTASFTFTTTNIPLGSTFGEAWPWDAEIAGNQPWPETPGASSTESFVDPLTGLLLQRVSVRGNGYGFWPSMPFSTAHNQKQAPCSSTGGWTNPCNAVGDSAWSTIGNSTAWLVLRNAMTTGNAWGGFNNDISYTSCCQIDQLQFNLTGYIPGCSGDTCMVDVCVSMNDGASCAGDIQTVTFGDSPSTQSVGSAGTAQFGATSWTFDTNPRFNMQESAPHFGQATVAGNQLTWSNGSPFSLYWVTRGNSTIRLSPTSQANACAPPPLSNDSTEYGVVSFVDGNNLILSGSPPQGSVYWCAQPFSIMIRRHAADSNTAYMQSASMAALESGLPYLPSNGANSAAFDTMVGGGWFVSFGGLSWINPATGQIIYYGNPYMEPGPPQNPWLGSRLCPNGNSGFWDNTQTMPTWYCSSTESGKYVVIRGRLMGGVPPAPTMPYADLAFETGCTSTDDYTITCDLGGGVTMVWDILTPLSLKQDLNSQLSLLDHGISAKLTSWSGTFSEADQVVEKGIFYLSFFSTGAMDSPAIILAFNPGDGVPANAGLPGGPALVGAVTTYNTGPVLTTPMALPSQTVFYGRTLHGMEETGGTGWVIIRGNNSSFVPVSTTQTSIPATSTTTCASLGITGNNNQCIRLQIDSYTQAGVTGYEPYLTGSDLIAPFTGAPGELRTTQIGDLACVEYSATASPILSQQCYYQGAEMLMLVHKAPDGLWTFQRNMYGYEGARDSGAPLTLYWSSVETSQPFQAQNGGLGGFWNPIIGCAGTADPHGKCLIQDTNDDGAHEFWRAGSATGAINIPDWRVISGPANGQWPFGYRSTPGPVTPSISFPWADNTPMAVAGVNLIHGNPAFAGATGGAWPGEASSHPSPPGDLASAADQMNGFDDVTFGGGSLFALDPTFTNVSGQLYVAALSVTDPDDIGYLNRKILPTAASCGNHPLQDVSGPLSVIDGTPINSYKYCAVRADGECTEGSAVGQVYVNCPGVIAPLTCNGSGLHGSTQLGVGNDICVHNAAANMQAVTQYGVNTTDFAGASRRTLVSDIGRLRMSAGFDNVRLLPDNSWLLFGNWWSDFQTVSVWMAKMPPDAAPDNVNRGTFIPVQLSLTPPSGYDSALVEFGYAEYSTPSALYCTTRTDTCISNQAAIPPAGSPPFQFLSESPAWMSCPPGSACTITVPALAQRILYCRAKYLNSSNNAQQTSYVTALVVD